MTLVYYTDSGFLTEFPTEGPVRLEQTFIMVKPDGVRRQLVGEIIRRFENKGLILKELRLLTPTRELAETHYGVHRGKPFFDSVVAFISSGPVVAMVWEGENVVVLGRKLMGATKPEDSVPGTIRGDFANTIQENLVHGSDSVENAQLEISIWFGAA